jgi:hypothetical protein
MAVKSPISPRISTLLDLGATLPVWLIRKPLQIQKSLKQTYLPLKSKCLPTENLIVETANLNYETLCRNVPSTVFKRFYERNDLPVVCSFSGATRSIEWKVNIDMLDYHHYLPVFFEGLREQADPCRFLADKGCDDLISKGGDKILPVLPQLILPIKNALQTK